MRLLSALLLAVLWLALMAATTQNSAQAAAPQRCCTSYFSPSGVRTLVRLGAVVACLEQDTRLKCNINARILVTRKGTRVCVNPHAGRIRKLLKNHCGGQKHPRPKKNRNHDRRKTRV